MHGKFSFVKVTKEGQSFGGRGGSDCAVKLSSDSDRQYHRHDFCLGGGHSCGSVM